MTIAPLVWSLNLPWRVFLNVNNSLVVTDILSVVTDKIPRPRLAVWSADQTLLRLPHVHLVVRNNFLVATRKFSRPWLGILHCYAKYTCAFHTAKSPQKWGLFVFCGLWLGYSQHAKAHKHR